MTESRFFVDGIYAVGAELCILGDDAHRIHHVLRLRRGDTIEICDSGGTVYHAEIREEGREIELRLTGIAHAPAENMLEITLAQCLPKGAKMDFIVEKATELGVGAILPVQSGRVIGERGSIATRQERWKRLAKAAAEQSRAQRIPLIHDVHSWTECIGKIAAYDRCFIPWELSTVTPRILERELSDVRRVLLIIGPEGGLSHEEIEHARAQGANDLSLGRRILRTETAGLVALSLMRYAANDL